MNAYFRTFMLVTPLLLTGCTYHQVGEHSAVTLDTGNDVVDAASYVVAGAHLQKKITEEKRKNGELRNPNDPVVKQMNEAIEKARAHKLGGRKNGAPINDAPTSVVVSGSASGGDW